VKKGLKPAQLRPQVDYLQTCYRVSQRRACEVLTLGRSSYRYHSVVDEQAALRIRLKDLAQTR
jgi:putative transposase